MSESDEKNLNTSVTAAHSDSRQVINIINKIPKRHNGCAVSFVVFLIFVAILVVVGKFSSVSSEDNMILDKDSLKKNFISGNPNSDKQILVINVSGIIAFDDSSSSFLSENIASAEAICTQLEAAAEDPEICGVILQINSPGGEVVAADTIYNAILKFKESEKPIVTQMESVAASGGYYIAAPTDKIIANELTTTGSIGVIIQSYKYYELLNKIGVQTESYTSGDKKDILSPNRPTTPAEQKILQNHIDKVFERFVAIVAANREGLTVDGIKSSAIASGQIFLGSEALELKLVDKLGYFQDAVDEVCGLSDISPDRCLIV
ncbi:MAG: signal peptide peptidase SppA, partial [Victivallaceae bacterium]